MIYNNLVVAKRFFIMLFDFKSYIKPLLKPCQVISNLKLKNLRTNSSLYLIDYNHEASIEHITTTISSYH